MEEFSQSRGDDDLFDDEIVPIESSSKPVEAIATQVEQITLKPALSEPADSSLSDPHQPTAARARGRGRGRGRGQTRDQPRSSGLGESKYAAKPTTPTSTHASKNESAKAPSTTEPVAAAAATDDPSPQTSSQQTESTGPPPSAPTGPSNPSPARPPAVRGDRTSTGGVRKPKLTEAELNEKLAAAKERSQNLAAAHARAQADADSFAERERMASEKRAKETQERKAMEGERERNRERKLRALGGREWDVGKDEQDFNARGPSTRRPADVENEADNDLSMYEWKEDRGRGRGRGRGGRGPRGGRGGRGDARNGGRQASGQVQPDVSAEADFPALPGTKDKSVPKPQAPVRKDSAPVTGSWADQVESSEAAGL